jgi:hypothetical protein
MLRCVRKEGKVFFASGSKILVLSTSKQFIHGRKGKNILQGMEKFTEWYLITIFFTKDNTRVFIEFLFHSKVFGFIIIS